jgi:hypothetical protein
MPTHSPFEPARNPPRGVERTRGRRWVKLAGLLLLMLVLGACARVPGRAAAGGSEPGTSVPGSTGDPNASDGSDGSGGGGDTVKPSPTPVTPQPGQAGVFARGWDDVHVADDDRTLTIDFVGGIESCSVLDHVDVDYADDAVTVTLYEGHAPDAGDVACIEIGVFKSVTIDLDESLGGRAVKDGAPK